MGEPIATPNESPTWVRARQFTGRVVTVTNDQVFETPVYNYTREFPFIWEEMSVPIPYKCDRHRAEQILLEAAAAETRNVKRLSKEEGERMAREYFVDLDYGEPHVYWRITDNWLELIVRFICLPHDARAVKDRMSRRILAAFDEAKIIVASSTVEIVGLPALRPDRGAARSFAEEVFSAPIAPKPEPPRHVAGPSIAARRVRRRRLRTRLA
jgi:small-conductance mechanosensitive channel